MIEWVLNAWTMLPDELTQRSVSNSFNWSDDDIYNLVSPIMLNVHGPVQGCI